MTVQHLCQGVQNNLQDCFKHKVSKEGAYLDLFIHHILAL